VSRLCTEIDERVQAFLGRPIEGDLPYLWIDATYVKVRDGFASLSKQAVGLHRHLQFRCVRALLR
jgi:transposase-like protein